MAREIVDLQLPSGEIVELDVDSSWTDEQIKERAVAAGLFEPAPAAPAPSGQAPSRAEQFLYGAAKTPGLIEEAANVLEQKFAPKREEQQRGVFVGGDVPMVDEAGNVQMDPRYPEQQVGTVTLPAITEETIRADQKAAKAAQLKQDFPQIVGTSYEGSSWVQAGAVTRMLTDMAAMPLPVAQQAALAKFAAGGGKLMGAEGRALLGKAMLEGGASIGVFGATDTAIRNMSQKGEIDASEVGLAALVSTAGGALVGPALATTGGKFVKWMKGRMESGSPVTTKELETVGKSMGLTADNAEFNALADAINKVSARQQIEAATVDLIHNPNTAMSITKDGKQVRALSKQEKKLRADIRKAFVEDADMADHLQRVAAEKEADRVLRNKAIQQEGVERVRIREALERQQGPVRPVSKANDEVVAAEIAARQDAALARLEHEAAVANTPTTAAHRAGQARRLVAEQPARDSGGFLRDPTQRRTVLDTIPKGEQWLNKLYKRAEQIAPRFAMALRRAETKGVRASNAAIEGMRPWLDNVAVQKAMKKSVKFRTALRNLDRQVMDEIVPGASALFDRTVAPVLNHIQTTRKAEGLDTLADFFPRAVKDVDKLRKQLDRAQRNELDEALRALEKRLGRRPNEDETAGVIGRFIGGRPIRQDKTRRIREITPEMEHLYVDAQATLLDHVHSFYDDVAKKEFYQNSLGRQTQLGQVLDEEGIATLLSKALSSGDLSTYDVKELAQIANAFFGAGRRSPDEAVRVVKDGVTLTTLGFNPFAVITQLGDVTINASRFGVEALKQALPGVGGRVAADAYNTGVRSLASEMRSQAGIARVVRRGLRSLGFAQLDEKFSNAATKSAYLNRVRQLQRSPDKFREDMVKYFTPDEARQMEADLAAGRWSDDLATLVANDVADVRPIGRLDMPLHYNQHPNGRLAYSLLSWSINQLNYVRNNAIAEIRKGNVVKGTKTLALMTVLFAAGGGLTGTTKDTLRAVLGGEAPTLEKSAAHAAGAAVPFGMTAKFAVDAMVSGRGSVWDVLPIAGIIDQGAKATLGFLATGDMDKLMSVTPLGRNLWDLAKFTFNVQPAEAAPFIPASFMLPKQGIPAGPNLNEPGIPDGWATLPEPEFTDEQLGLTVPKNKPAEQFKVAKELLVQREGNISKVYRDSEGFPTAGIGHLLTDAERKQYAVGEEVPQEVRDRWFKEDSAKAFAAARKQAAEINRPDMVPVLASVNFQLGTAWNKEHKRTWEYMKQGDWTSAAMEAANSSWFKQTPVRVRDLQKALLQGIVG